MLSDNELTQCVGSFHENINALMQKADDDAATAEDENDTKKMLQIGRYKLYLSRTKKAYMIQERKKDISVKLGAEFRGPTQQESMEILYASTSDYMNWIKSDKISFECQPALSPEETGVPTIRRFLFNLPASQNLRAYHKHINYAVPAFVDKLKRVVTESDRDAGFKTIADGFNAFRIPFLNAMVKQIQQTLPTYSKVSVGKIRKDSNAYKKDVDNQIKNGWLTLKSAAFTRILKSRGTVPQGTSKARGLERTVNWNAELAHVLRPGFQKWYATHSELLKLFKAALPMQLHRLHHETVKIINESAANLITVEKARNKWAPHRQRMQSKLTAMLDEMTAEQTRLRNRATLEDDRENNLIASITDAIYDDVFATTPEYKVTAPGKRQRYVTPVLKFRKHRLEKYLISPNDHFVDRVIDTFQDQLDTNMRSIVDKHFAKLHAMFDDFSTLMHEYTPVDYVINPMGEKLRADLEQQIPYIEGLAKTLQNMLPSALKKEEGDSAYALDEQLDESADLVHDLDYFLDKVARRKRLGGATSCGMAKRIKLEAY